MRIKTLPSTEVDSLIVMAFGFVCFVSLLFTVSAAANGIWWGIPICASLLTVAFFCTKWIRSRLDRQGGEFWLDEEGVRQCQSGPFLMRWNEVSSITWQINSDHGIRFTKATEGRSFPKALWSQKFQLIEPAFRERFLLTVRQHTRHATQKNWESFCLNRAIACLDSTKRHSVMRRYPRLVSYKDRQQSERAQTEGKNQVSLLIGLLSPQTFWYLAGLISFSTLFNSVVIAGVWVSPIVETCLGFSVVMALLGWGIHVLQNSVSSCKPIKIGASGTGIWSGLALAGLIVFAPSMFSFGVSLGGSLGNAVMLVTFLSFQALMIAAVGVFAWGRSTNTKKLSVDAVRCWNAIEHQEFCQT